MSSDSRFCHNCGAPLAPGSSFCSRCGTQVFGATPPSPPATPAPPSYPYGRQRHEKQEKHEKNEKNEKNEKGGGRGSGGLVGPIVGGLILVWLGVTFYLEQNGTISSSNWWAYFIVGIGAILILQGVLLFGMQRRPFFGPFIGGAVLLIIGLSYIANNYSWGNFWPLIFIVIGAVVIISAFTGRRRTPMP